MLKKDYLSMCLLAHLTFMTTTFQNDGFCLLNQFLSFSLSYNNSKLWYENKRDKDSTRFFFSSSSSFFPHNSYHMYCYYYILQLLHTYNNTYPKPKVLWRLFSKLMIIHPVFDKYSQKWSNKCFLSTIQNQSRSLLLYYNF